MSRKFQLAVISLLFLSFSCASTVQNVQEPVGDKCLIVGAVIVDVNGYQDLNSSFWDNIEVAIIGEAVEQGLLKRVSFWAETDENGYFYLENVPPGKYAIKGIRLRSIDLGQLTLANELTDPQRNYFEIFPANRIPMTGDLFDVIPTNRVINFQYNLFTLHRNGIVRFQRMSRIRDYKLSAGDIIDLPPVPSYFLDKFSSSGWSTFLDLQVN